MRFNKKALIITIVSVGAVIIGSVLIANAYFTDYTVTDNTITPAENILEISEEYEPPVEQEEGENIYKKRISIENNGNSPCYIRVYMDFSDSDVRSRSYLSNDPGMNPGSFFSAERSSEGTTYISRLELVAPNWVFVPDDSLSKMAGYYYYKNPVPAGEATEPLMTYVKTVNADQDDIKQYDIMVYAESIQLSDSQGRVFDNYTDAWENTL